MWQKLLLLSMLTSSFLSAGVENYFQKITNKSGNHRMRNIDFIYMINLDERPEKFAASQKQLAPYGVQPYRFSAVNGWKLTIDALNDLGVKYEAGMPKDLWGTSYADGTPQHEVMNVIGKTYFCHCMTRGAIGIVLSHLSILQDAYDSGYQTIWVMEDDVEVIRDPNILPNLIDELDAFVGPDRWDILFTDRDTKNKQGAYVPCMGFARKPNFHPPRTARFSLRKTISPNFRKIGARYGAYSMIVRRSGMKKLLDFIKTHKVFLPYDMEFYLPLDVRMYTVVSDVVSTLPDALSDNGAPNYKHKLLLKD